MIIFSERVVYGSVQGISFSVNALHAVCIFHNSTFTVYNVQV